jgi:hypothetical protein
VSFAAIILYVVSQRVFLLFISLRPSPETFGYTLVDGGERSASRHGRFTPREITLGTHCIGGWLSPRAGLDAGVRRKIPPPPIMKPVAQRYTTELHTII